MQNVIKETESPTATTTLSETTVLTPTSTLSSTAVIPTPQNQQPVTLPGFMQLIQKKPWIPLGVILAILLAALILIVVTAQRKTTGVQATPITSGDTAELSPRPALAQNTAFLQLKLLPETTFPLSIDDLTIGRAPDNSIVILPKMPGAETVSHYHARLYHTDRWILEDLDSTNGTYVNGQRTGRNYLRNGWEIGIGGVIFVFHTDKAEV